MSVRQRFKSKLKGIFNSRPSSPVNTSSPSQPESVLGSAVNSQGSTTSIPHPSPIASEGPIADNARFTEIPAAAHSVPIVVVTPSASDSLAGHSKKDVVIDNLTLVFDTAEKLAELAQNVPFIAPVAGALSQILKAYKEVKNTDAKRDALLVCITGITDDLCSTILRMEQINHIDLVGRLKRDIETYARLLKEASVFVSEYDELGLIRRSLARNHLGGNFSDLQGRLDSFGARFRANRLVDLAIQQTTVQKKVDKIYDMALEKTDFPCVFLGADVTQQDIKFYICEEMRDNNELKIWASRADDVVDRVARSAWLLVFSSNSLGVNGKMS
ncbi:hypothetical protein MVEN_00903700 [Mycena venus]|uniref:Uncharacterized protein n=1 Tax=Mycena venus TaxID=2733690 RepID=A0A8H7D4J8_9AGAR|nr:hypothetical protein MVEN_00903700 [Mycena venus]